MWYVVLIFHREQVGENDTKVRWYSVLSSENCTTIKSENQAYLKSDVVLGKRYESTAAASDASSSLPAEKYEYQAEVLSISIHQYMSSYYYQNLLLFWVNAVYVKLAGQSTHGPHC